jgi:hypothetical protein
VFFGIDDPIESSNIVWNYEQYRERLLPNLLPIACDDGADLICLMIDGEDTGAVLFWDGYAVPHEPDCSNVYYVASSFAEFIDACKMLLGMMRP